MGLARASLLAAAIVWIGAAAVAAELPPPPLPVVAPVESGWYLRGDVGVGQLHSKDIEFIPNPKNAGTDFAIEHSSIGDTAFVAFGVGYAWNNWLRSM